MICYEAFFPIVKNKTNVEGTPPPSFLPMETITDYNNLQYNLQYGGASSSLIKYIETKNLQTRFTETTFIVQISLRFM